MKRKRRPAAETMKPKLWCIRLVARGRPDRDCPHVYRYADSADEAAVDIPWHWKHFLEMVYGDGREVYWVSAGEVEP